MRKKDLSMTRKYRKEKNERNRSKRNRNRDTELSLRQKEFEHRPPYTLTDWHHIFTRTSRANHTDLTRYMMYTHIVQLYQNYLHMMERLNGIHISFNLTTSPRNKSGLNQKLKTRQVNQMFKGQNFKIVQFPVGGNSKQLQHVTPTIKRTSNLTS